MWAAEWGEGVAVSVDEGRRSGVESTALQFEKLQPTYPIRPRHHFCIFLLEFSFKLVVLDGFRFFLIHLRREKILG